MKKRFLAPSGLYLDNLQAFLQKREKDSKKFTRFRNLIKGFKNIPKKGLEAWGGLGNERRAFHNATAKTATNLIILETTRNPSLREEIKSMAEKGFTHVVFESGKFYFVHKSISPGTFKSYKKANYIPIGQLLSLAKPYFAEAEKAEKVPKTKGAAKAKSPPAKAGKTRKNVRLLGQAIVIQGEIYDPEMKRTRIEETVITKKEIDKILVKKLSSSAKNSRVIIIKKPKKRGGRREKIYLMLPTDFAGKLVKMHKG